VPGELLPRSRESFYAMWRMTSGVGSNFHHAANKGLPRSNRRKTQEPLESSTIVEPVEPIFIQLIRQLAACPPNTCPAVFPSAYSPSFRNGWSGKPRFDTAVASCGYYRQRATGHHRPAAREQSHLLRLRQLALHLLSACISGSQALMKGGRNDHV
jgi:hypothetical protein